MNIETQANNTEELCIEIKVQCKYNRERHLKQMRDWRKANKEKIKAYYELNIKEQRRSYYEANKEHFEAQSKTYYEANKERRKILNKKYREENKEVLSSRHRERCAADSLYKLIHSLRSNSTRAFKRIGINKPVKTETLLGCSWQEAKEHMEKLFQPSMTWANHGAWHIDHKVPIASATTIEEAIALNHISNLQPLWALDNLVKSAKQDIVSVPQQK